MRLRGGVGGRRGLRRSLEPYNRSIDASPIEILVLCTANICRSPVAEGLLRERLRQAGVPARVSSAGFLRPGSPASQHSAELAAELGLDLSEHRSRRVSAASLAGADLLLAMARAHVREAVVIDRSVWPRAFTLKELVRRGGEIGPRRGEPVEGWLARAHQGRTVYGMLGDSGADDVADPVGQPRSAYERMLAELDNLTLELVDLAWPSAP